MTWGLSAAAALAVAAAVVYLFAVRQGQEGTPPVSAEGTGAGAEPAQASGGVAGEVSDPAAGEGVDNSGNTAVLSGENGLLLRFAPDCLRAAERLLAELEGKWMPAARKVCGAPRRKQPYVVVIERGEEAAFDPDVDSAHLTLPPEGDDPAVPLGILAVLLSSDELEEDWRAFLPYVALFVDEEAGARKDAALDIGEIVRGMADEDAARDIFRTKDKRLCAWPAGVPPLWALLERLRSSNPEFLKRYFALRQRLSKRGLLAPMFGKRTLAMLLAEAAGGDENAEAILAALESAFGGNGGAEVADGKAADAAEATLVAQAGVADSGRAAGRAVAAGAPPGWEIVALNSPKSFIAPASGATSQTGEFEVSWKKIGREWAAASILGPTGPTAAYRNPALRLRLSSRHGCRFTLKVFSGRNKVCERAVECPAGAVIQDIDVGLERKSSTAKVLPERKILAVVFLDAWSEAGDVAIGGMSFVER